MSLPTSRTAHPNDRGLTPDSALFADDAPVLPPVRKQLPLRVLGVLTVLSFVVLSLATWSALSH